MSWLYQQFNGIIESCIQKSVGNKTKFAICPYGENAWMVEHLLYQSYGISDVLLIDNRLCKYNENIKGIAELTDTDIENRFFILSSNNGEIRNQLQSIVKEDFICMPEFFVQNAESYSYGPLFTCNNVEGIGRFSCIAEGACVVPNHPMNCVTTHEFMYSSFHFSALNMGNNDLIKWNEINPKKTHIGNDVWIGRNVIITNGASIGNGAIIGAGSVVTKDIPDYAIAVGNPARVIRYRFTPEQIEQLNKIKWWDWPVEKIKGAYQDFKNIDTFIEKYGTEHEDKTCQK